VTLTDVGGFRGGDVVLRDGSTVHVRGTGTDDEQPLIAFYLHLSERSRYMRFMSAWGHFDELAAAACDPDPRRVDLVATKGDRIVAHAMYYRTQSTRAEVAFAVDDELHGQGLASLMLGQLTQIAARDGIDTFEAITLPHNSEMLGVFRASGFNVVTKTSPDEIDVEFPTSLTSDALARFDTRDQVAAAAAVRALLAPRSIAVIGASREPGSIGAAILQNLVAGGYTGTIYPVNPSAEAIQHIPCHPNVASIPDAVELAVIVVPAPKVNDVARECAAKGVHGLVVISAGFGETGEEGAARQAELLRICRGSGIRLIGPNCFGVINTDPTLSMNATFARSMPPAGNIGFLSQSGALGLAVIDRTKELGLGLSTFVSNGNKADISGNDLLSYWETDDRTDVIMLYLESFGNPRKFARVARRVGGAKPILAVKSGRSRAGARATGSHTGALVAASDVNVDALFRQSGVIRCSTLGELFDTAQLFSTQPMPQGNRVAIVTNAGGLGIMCTDACDADGLDVVGFSDDLQVQLRSFLPTDAAVANPVDMIASATPDDYSRAIDAIAASSESDAIIAIFIPPRVTDPHEVAAAFAAATDRVRASQHPLTMLGVLMSDDTLVSARSHLPTYPYPEDAVRALGHAMRYHAWRQRPDEPPRSFGDTRPDEAAAVIRTALERGPGWLGADEIAELLDTYGINRLDQRVVTTPDEAGEAAESIGFPVVLKADVRALIHKTDVGGVTLGLRSAEEVRVEATAMSERLIAAGHRDPRFLVQPTAASGVEMLVGVVHDETFGPVLAVGSGGTTAELTGDVAVRLTPLSPRDVTEMVGSLRAARLLAGYRGSAPTDVPAFEELIQRVGALVESHDEIVELDLNPVAVTPDGATVLDARIRVEAAQPKPLFGARG
jgi:acetyl coenzyme A synthetase (ADP forming)-like protein